MGVYLVGMLAAIAFYICLGNGQIHYQEGLGLDYVIAGMASILFLNIINSIMLLIGCRKKKTGVMLAWIIINTILRFLFYGTFAAAIFPQVGNSFRGYLIILAVIIILAQIHYYCAVVVNAHRLVLKHCEGSHEFENPCAGANQAAKPPVLPPAGDTNAVPVKSTDMA